MKKIIALLCMMNLLQADPEFDQKKFEKGFRTPEQKKCEDSLKEALSNENFKEAATIFAGTECASFFKFFCDYETSQKNDDVDKLVKTIDPEVAALIAPVTSPRELQSLLFYMQMASFPVMKNVLQMHKNCIDGNDLRNFDASLLTDISFGEIISPNKIALLQVLLEEKREEDLRSSIVYMTSKVFKAGVGPTALLFRNLSGSQILERYLFQRMISETTCTVNRHVIGDENQAQAVLQIKEREATLKDLIRFVGNDFFKEKQTGPFKKNSKFENMLSSQAQWIVGNGGITAHGSDAAKAHVAWIQEIKKMRTLPKDIIVVQANRSNIESEHTMWQKIIDGLLLEEVVGNILIPMSIEKSPHCIPEAHDVIAALDDIAQCAREYKKAGRMTKGIIRDIKDARFNFASDEKNRKYNRHGVCIEISKEEELLLSLIDELQKED